LACEYVKLCQGQACGLNPNIVQAVQREGVSFALVTPGDVFKYGGFGVPQIDAAVARDWLWQPNVVGPAGKVFDPRRRFNWT
jgi:hypothetical protein